MVPIKQIVPVVALAMLVAMSAACNKSKDQGNPVSGTNLTDNLHTYDDPSIDLTHLNQLFAGFRSTPQTFSVPAGTYWRLRGAGGTLLSFYPNSFKDAAGNIISTGSMQVTLVEMYKPGAMIANRAATTADGSLLISGGQVDLTVTQNGQPVYANKYSIGFYKGSSSSQPMSLYTGNTNSPDSVVNWTKVPQAPGTYVPATVLVNNDSAQAGPWKNPPLPLPPGPSYYYLFDSCTQFHMINCDYFTSYTPLTSMTAIAPDSVYTKGNTTIYLVFPSINCVTTFKTYNKQTHTFGLSGGYQVPVGMTATLIALSNIGGDYYFEALPNITITQDMVINLAMQPQTAAYVTNALLNL